MEKSYLIQRLKAPMGLVNPFAFGAGGGRLSKEAIEATVNIWSYDYMGAAEFEYGNLPEALQKMADAHENLVCGSVVLHYNHYSFAWKNKPAQKCRGEKRVYYLCHKDHEKEIKKRLAAWAVVDSTYDTNTKERVGLSKGMAEEGHPDYPVVGWLELDNGFMFFTDEKMWRGACSLFGVKTPSKKKVKKK